MPTKRLGKEDKKSLKILGEKIAQLILEKKKYKSLDAFSLEFHDNLTKPTLYQICDGKRDMKLSTLFGLCRALGIHPSDLLSEI